MESVTSLACSQELAIGPYPEPDESCPHTFTSYFPMTHSNIIFRQSLGLPSGLYPSGFPTTNLYPILIYPMCAICPAHLILPDSTNPVRPGAVYDTIHTLVADTTLVVVPRSRT
jgi:hypothetical protein